ncbi:hypothetical protein RJ640_026812 [Escallonia rubra]|uniref:Uncharacterized protein n=1 Tax=Escallonia rubra TaxID=112253 RepID=A0AA88QQ91_9ASTE|nr:hypothetical protein RJ640_026812 [Escallonia rubra]
MNQHTSWVNKLLGQPGKIVELTQNDQENDLVIPMKDGPEANKIPKEILKKNSQEVHLFSIDDRAKNTTSYGLDVNDYNRVSACETMQDMWRMLEVTQEDTNQVNETKKNMLLMRYEASKMKENESTNEIYSRFTLIINGLKLLRKVCPKNEMIHDEEATTSKNKSVALKAEVSHELEESSNDSDNDMALITRKFK